MASVAAGRCAVLYGPPGGAMAGHATPNPSGAEPLTGPASAPASALGNGRGSGSALADAGSSGVGLVFIG